jgi:uncharacterized protein YndB with AHSA1/START domain
MGDLLTYTLIGVGILAGILALIALVGLLLPKSHQVSRSVALKQTPDAVWQVISDFPNEPTWHGGIERVERLPDKDGHEVWRETFSGGYPMQLETLEAVPPRRLVRAIADERGPFTGRWEFDVAPIETGCRVTIIEYGDVANPFFRVMARLFMHPAIYIEIYLKALAGKFNEQTPIEK